jgi:hypothetical protein
MAQLLIELPPEVYQELKTKAETLGKSPQQLAQEVLVTQFDAPEPFKEDALSERERGRRALKAAGLLTELDPELKARAAQSTLTVKEAQEILGRVPGTPLSEIVIEQREPNL